MEINKETTKKLSSEAIKQIITKACENTGLDINSINMDFHIEAFNHPDYIMMKYLWLRCSGICDKEECQIC